MATEEDPTTYLTFGELLRFLREQSNIGLRELSRVTGIATSYVWYLEMDRNLPGEKITQTLARTFGVSAEWLEAEKEPRTRLLTLRRLGFSRRTAFLLNQVQPLSRAEEKLVNSIFEHIVETRAPDD